jgi:hypothetical protein
MIQASLTFMARSVTAARLHMYRATTPRCRAPSEVESDQPARETSPEQERSDMGNNAKERKHHDCSGGGGARWPVERLEPAACRDAEPGAMRRQRTGGVAVNGDAVDAGDASRMFGTAWVARNS